jgi:hypothetical protein
MFISAVLALARRLLSKTRGYAKNTAPMGQLFDEWSEWGHERHQWTLPLDQRQTVVVSKQRNSDKTD